MTTFLSDEWLTGPNDPTAAVLAARGRPMRVVRVVTGGAEREVRRVIEVDADGSVTWRRGAPDDAEADLTLTNVLADAKALVRGEADENALFMQGRTKVAGSTGVLFEYLAASKDPDAAVHRAAIEAATEF